MLKVAMLNIVTCLFVLLNFDISTLANRQNIRINGLANNETIPDIIMLAAPVIIVDRDRNKTNADTRAAVMFE